jgi:hypothetical protein
MSHYIPDSIPIQYALNPQIKAVYTKYKKITFISPEELKGRVVNNLFEASFVVRNVPSFPYSDWIVVDKEGGESQSKTWNVWSFERSATTYMKRLKTSETPQHSTIQTEPDDTIRTDVIDPRTIQHDQWTSDLVADWICSMQKPILPLKRITHFRRYGAGLSFEFLCVWDLKGRQISTWQKYTTIMQQKIYEDYLRTHWDSKIEKERNWEDEIDRNTKDEGFDVNLPEIGNAYAIEDVTIRAQRLMEKEEQKRKKSRKNKEKTPKYQAKDSDAEVEESDLESSPSEESSESETDSDVNQSTVTQTQPQEHVEWMDIFEMSSVNPVPRYQVKQFKEKK